MKKDKVFWIICIAAAAVLAADIALVVYTAVKFGAFTGGLFAAKGYSAFCIAVIVLNAVTALVAGAYLLLRIKTKQ